MRFKFPSKNSLAIQILSVFIIFNILSIFLFACYITQKQEIFIEESATESLQIITQESAELISNMMMRVEYETENIADWAKAEIENADVTEGLPNYYKRTEEGVLYRENVQNSCNQESDVSNIYLSQDILMTDDLLKEIVGTEQLDPIFSKIFERIPYLQWISIANKSGFLRVWPYLTGDVLGPNQQEQGPFYIIANQQNNPERKTVWTKPYVDYFNAGWVMSCTHPIDINGEMIGAVVLDVSLKTLQEYLADFRLGTSGFIFILNEDGEIIYHPDYIPSEDHKWDLMIENIFEVAEPNREYLDSIRKMLLGKNGIVTYKNKFNEESYISYAKVEGQPWMLGVEVKKEAYIGENEIKDRDLLVFSGVLLIMLVLITYYLYNHFSKPFNNLIQSAERLEKGEFVEIAPISNYDEIEGLSRTLNSMSQKIKIFTNNLIQKNNEVEGIFKSIPDLLMIVNPQYEILMINKGRRQYFGDCKKNKCFRLLGRSTSVCKGCRISEVLRTQMPIKEKVVIGNDIFQNFYYPIRDINKNIYGVIVHSQKITQNVMMEKELIQSEKMAGIGQLSSAIAHELKNPLSVIGGTTYLLHQKFRGYNDLELADSIQTIDSMVTDAERIISNMLNFAAPQSMAVREADIIKIINQIIILSKYECKRKNIKVVANYQEPQMTYFGSAEPLKHICFNLIGNAVKAIDQNGIIEIDISYINDCRDLKISIKDNGHGIGHKIEGQIFKPFFTTNEDGGNSGLGLWITKNIVEKLNGTIQFNSITGTGTEFIIVLPNAKRSDEE